MPYKTGSWGEQEKARNKKRLEYFKEYNRKKYKEKYKEKFKKNYIRKFNGFGSLGEKIGLKLLLNSKLVRKKYYDIEWQNKKIEIKIAKFGKILKGWYFHTGRQKKHTDYFLLICMKQDKQTIVRIYLIPDNLITSGGATVITYNSKKYEKFKL